MRRLVLKLSEDAYKAIKTEATVYGLTRAGGEMLPVIFAAKVVKAIDAGEGELEIKTRVEREEDKNVPVE